MERVCKSIASIALLAVCGCHPILDADPLKVVEPNRGAGPDFQVQQVADQGEGEARAVDAIGYCTELRNNARRFARRKEIAGFTIGTIGILGGGLSTAIVAESGDTTNKELASVGVAAGAVLTSLAAYLLASAATDRTGDGLLSASLIQMGDVDPFFVTAPAAKTRDSTDTLTQTINSSSPGVATDQVTTTTTTTKKPNVETSIEDKTVHTGGTQGSGSAPTPSIDGELPENDGAKREHKRVTVQHELIVEPAVKDVAARVQWQTCAKVIATWQAGAGASLTTAAGAVSK